jgi:hypothetical protein
MTAAAVDTATIIEKAQILSAYCDDLIGGERLNRRYTKNLLWSLIAAAPRAGDPCIRATKAARLKATMEALIKTAAQAGNEDRVVDLVRRAEAEVAFLFQPKWRGHA